MTPEHKKLSVFLGRWHTTGDVAATPSTPAATVDAIDTYEWYPGEFFMVHHADGTVGKDAIKSIEIIDCNGNASYELKRSVLGLHIR